MEKHNLEALWDEHTKYEFATPDVEATLATMVEDAYVNHVPVMTGGKGKSALRTFYSTDFIPCMPPDFKMTDVSRTVGENQLVDEMVISFTHTIEMPWLLPGVGPTGRYVEVPARGHRQLPRRQARAREHLLGPGLGTEADRPPWRR